MKEIYLQKYFLINNLKYLLTKNILELIIITSHCQELQMKKVLIILLLMSVLFITTIPVFASDFLAVGGGFKIIPYTENISISADYYESAIISYDWNDYSVYAFFDAKYIELNVSYYRALTGIYEQTNFGGDLDLKTEYAPSSISYLDLSLIGKIPLTIGPAGNTFLFAGFSYKLNLTSDYGYINNNGDVKKEFWDQMWIKSGFSIDIPLHSKIFVRSAFSLAFPLKTKEWDNRIKAMKYIFAEADGLEVNYFGIGAELTIAVGYKIK